MFKRITSATFLAILTLCAVSCRTTADGGLDLTYPVRTYNKNGSYNQVDIEGYIIFLVLIVMFYYGGKWAKEDKAVKLLMYILFGLLVLLPIVALLPK